MVLGDPCSCSSLTLTCYILYEEELNKYRLYVLPRYVELKIKIQATYSTTGT